MPRLLELRASYNTRSSLMALTREPALGRPIMIITTVAGSEIPRHIMEYSYGSRSGSKSPSNSSEEVHVESEASLTHSMRAIPTG
jgi:hypothetical protein